MSQHSTRIAIAGVGTVGNGVLDLLFKNKVIEKYNISIVAIASRRKINRNNIKLKKTKIFKDARSLLSFNDFDVLIELIGGEEGIAKEIVFNALSNGKRVITANKALISKHWVEIKKICNQNGASINFEAAVAGGVPIIKIIQEFLSSNKISKIYGILNGTSNFILTGMLSKNQTFEKILRKAQDLGFAEADPSFDIDGVDAAHKLSILASLAFNINCNLKKISIEGIRGIDLVDLKYSYELGYKIKLLAITYFKSNNLLCSVYPCLVNQNDIIASVDGVYNGLVIESDFCKKSFLQGEGAGAYPTATSVVSDLISISKKTSNDPSLKQQILKHKNLKLSERFGGYYLRFSTIDKSGVISDITKEFKKNNISMKSMLQRDREPGSKNATIIMTTHKCYEKEIHNALNKINSLKNVIKKTVSLRIENFK